MRTEDKVICFFQFQKEQREIDHQHEIRMIQLIDTMQQQHTHQCNSPASPMFPRLAFNNDGGVFTPRYYQNQMSLQPISLRMPPPSPTCNNIQQSKRLATTGSLQTNMTTGIQHLKVLKVLSLVLFDRKNIFIICPVYLEFIFVLSLCSSDVTTDHLQP